MLINDIEIAQLLPAAGWQALFSNATFDDYFTTPLISWAHIRAGERRSDVVGLVPVNGFGGELGVADWYYDFIGFLGPSEPPPTKVDLAEQLELIKIGAEERRGSRPSKTKSEEC